MVVGFGRGPKKRPRLAVSSPEELAKMAFAEMSAFCDAARQQGKDAPNPRPYVAGKQVRLEVDDLRQALASFLNSNFLVRSGRPPAGMLLRGSICASSVISSPSMTGCLCSEMGRLANG